MKKHLLAGAKKPRRAKALDHEMIMYSQQLACDHSILQEGICLHRSRRCGFRVLSTEWIQVCIVTVNLNNDEDDCPWVLCGIWWLLNCSVSCNRSNCNMKQATQEFDEVITGTAKVGLMQRLMRLGGQIRVGLSHGAGSCARRQVNRRNI